MDYTKFSKIDTFIFDVDGVFTNSDLLVMENGDFLRKMHVRDGSAIKSAVANGYRIAIITKGNSKGVKERLLGLGAFVVYDAVENKATSFKDLVKKHKVNPNTAVYMGDDLADLVVFDKVLLGACPYDAAPEVIQKSEYISSKKGGEGCIRDIIEKVMRTQGKWGK